ncbi:MAG: hotdog fold thioesterase [Calditrichaeota bacterium]|nr:MAG: hotdog fold thioesterase [Calditrichota bacterium]
MSIWFKAYTLSDFQHRSANTMIEHLGIELIEIGEDYLVARMPVDHRTKQPEGLLHGGASLVLAETLGSVGAFLCIDPTRKQVFGLEINANHLRAVQDGYVVGTARPIHRGNSVHVWEIKIQDEKKNLVCISRITLLIQDRRNK